jgi:uncharacterized membrane protein YdbT with pleckstrin-like domain
MSIDDYLSKQLKEGEDVSATIRRHPAVLVPSVGFGAVIVLADFFLVAWWFQHRSWGAAGFGLVACIGLILIGRGLFEWTRNILVITNQRVIDVNQRGFFSRSVAEATYDKIQDVQSTVSGLWQTMFQYGSIVLKTAGAGTTLDIHGIRHPQEVQRIITDAQQSIKNSGSSNLSASELIHVVDELRQRLGSDEFDRLIKRRPPSP